ncbi:unnamed protein product [Musa acuminata subsp. malaccensis]|uniref:(wild Malaysian banana) hypothetical protein n=1 Tax=Musa acuminata subsp. malaccensis TaxID=214687 RepID=A0A804KZN4_MUSAM|nr:PREDICTED: pentatricopeptide repeat-containing protein At2g03380, mitochondrial isoform X1 [Musa acuminata subsp. malaccensis]CAG1854441.1 unnamed protein product [Musa acuminata subsp. malaccensis]
MRSFHASKRNACLFPSPKTKPCAALARPLNPSDHHSRRSLSTHFIKQPPDAPDRPHSPSTFLPLLSSCPDIAALRRIHGLILVHGLHRHLPCQTKLFSSYGSLGDIESARMVFDRIPDPDLYSWRVMLRWYVLNKQYADAIRCYLQMRYRFRELDNTVFSLVLKACVKLLDLDEGRKLHGHTAKVGGPDSFVLNVLIDMYAKCGDMDSSRRLFDGLEDRNVVSWTSMISAYAQNDCAAEAVLLFNRMQEEDVELNEYTVGSMFTACSMLDSLHQGKWVHGRVIKHGMCMNSFVGSALLDMYVKCGEVADARSVFDELDDVDLISWTAMIVGYTQRRCPLEALKLFSDTKWVAMVPNSVTIASVLSASAQLRDLESGNSIHALGIKLGIAECSVVMNALVDMYAKCCMLEEANSIFKRVYRKDVVTWNAMVAGYSQNHQGQEALTLFNQMRSDGCSPDAVTVVCVLSSCACLGDIHLGSSLHAYAIKFGFLSNTHVGTTLINFYNKYGDVTLANRVFDEMSNRNAVTWCAMMCGYGMQGDSAGSIDLFRRMVEKDLQPNEVTFTSILSTCSHTGMVDEGREYFDSMSKHYNISPSMRHYACMVDMLARAGKIEEALEFIDRMPVQADIDVWGALLHGCRMHSRFELGEVAVKRMMELLPHTSDYYVLMSNLYASDGRWNEAVQIRKLMKERGLVKLPGCSSLGMNNP